ncbi:hypothetical protein F0562_011431 [Nyssa sinensis]|uniref:F-box domain-containing protein n=1 Tax=Nyssa sinensis TaxID=561372 RepID=A0A5J5A677_9ASTE|nr:hypothetical protein F0562_011431 [Nyssa sinensis]
MKIISLVTRDRISSLADDLLIHILSFLPTHFAVRTSVLSKIWRHLWTFMENLHFDDRLWRYRITSPLGNSATNDPTIDHTFDSFVEQILYRNQNPLLNFRLHCSELHDFSRINGWIESAVERKVREIDLFLTERFSGQLTSRIYTCETLVVLRMRMPTNCNLHIPTNAAAFPSLKILHVSVAVTSLMEELFSKCPVLEELQIDGITRLPENVFRIHVPTLKRIAIKIARRNIFTYFHCFHVMAPALECIDINDNTISIYTLNQHSLIKAKVDVGGGAAEFLSDANHPAIQALGIRALCILHVVDSAKFLSLSASTICASFLGVFFVLGK